MGGCVGISLSLFLSLSFFLSPSAVSHKLSESAETSRREVDFSDIRRGSWGKIGDALMSSGDSVFRELMLIG